MKLSVLGRFAGKLRDACSPRRKVLAEVRAAWARSGGKEPWLASRYFELTRNDSPRAVVDDRTWTDLELPAVFATLDTTISPIGSQVLLAQMRSYAGDSARLAERFETYRLLRADQRLREEIQLKLAHLRADSCATIADYLFGPPPRKPPRHRLLMLFGAASAAALVAVVALPLTIWLWLPFVAVNTVLIHVVTPRLQRDADALRACGRLLRAAELLAAVGPEPRIPELAALAADAEGRARARRALRLFPAAEDSLLLGSVWVWLNFLFLAELIVYCRTVDRFVACRREIAAAYEAVGSLDAAIAVASFLERCPHCRPEIAAHPLLHIRDGYHPLIAAPTVNTVRLDGRSALVTGSNMAGKTTFIKMVGANVLLGGTLGVCLASAAVIPRSTVMAAVRGEHSVESGKSHYFAEVEAVREFLQSAASGACSVFVIDELFSGTNTIERIAAARAVLEALSARAQVLVTTHDVELQNLLPDVFELYHFQENPEVEGYFDYRLRPGAAIERNAIRLLARLGFPPAIVAEAFEYAAEATSGEPGTAAPVAGISERRS